MRFSDKTFKEVGKEFPKGTVLFKEGDPGIEMYLICSGEVKLTRKTPNGEVIMATLGFGEFFGEMSVITNKPRTVTAVAVSDCKLNVISKDILETLISSNPLVALSILKKLLLRLESSYNQIEELYNDKYINQKQ
ncbi:MAG: Crp/Fnr family transcriptional regulator [Candidatus Scalinduaceae bacterium]